MEDINDTICSSWCRGLNEQGNREYIYHKNSKEKTDREEKTLFWGEKNSMNFGHCKKASITQTSKTIERIRREKKGTKKKTNDKT